MNQLERTLTSLEVSEMVGREHYNVLKEIRVIIEQLGDEVKSYANYFIESNYIDALNRKKPSYLLTKKGCELYGTRMTGEKGTLFAVKYIDKFNEMEEHIKKPLSNLEIMQMQIQQLIEQEKKMNELEQQQIEIKSDIENIAEIVSLTSDDWRKETDKIISGICYSIGNKEAYSEIRKQIYRELEVKGKCNLETRLNNLKKRCLEYGVSKSKVDKKNYLDAIQEDARLKEIYVGIVKNFAIKYKYKK